MEKHKEEGQRLTLGRLSLLYTVMVFATFGILGRIAFLQYFSDSTAANSQKLRLSIITKDTLYARRGTIFSRDEDRPLATSIFRYRVFFDTSAEGCDDEDRFREEADSLCRLLASFFGDKSADEYFEKLMSCYGRRFQRSGFRVDTIRHKKWIGARLYERLFGRRTSAVLEEGDYLDTVYFEKRKHSQIKLFRDVDINEWEQLQKFPLLNRSMGLIYQTEMIDSRIYPQGELAKGIIGRINVTGGRDYGLEHAFVDSLLGHGGWRWKQCIAPAFYTQIENDYRHPNREPINGCDLTTTIDVDIQDIADKALRKQLKIEKAFWGTVIVMDVETGDLLAVVNQERTKDGNYYEGNNFALKARKEPGSTFKITSVLSLLQIGGRRPSLSFDSGSGCSVMVGKAKVIDSHNIGSVIDMRTAFAQSANVYFTKAIYTTFGDNPMRYVDFLRDSLHLGDRMGLEYLDEAKPRIPYPCNNYRIWTPHQTLPNMGYGYAVELAPIHTATIYNAVANGGKMMAPRLIKKMSRDGVVLREFPPVVLNERIASERNIEVAKSFMEAVSTEGTAKNYFGTENCPYRTGTKTGTAKDAQGHKYSDGYYLGSMALYMPAEKPKYTIFVAIFNKKGNGHVYGASLAGPVQKEIADYLYGRERVSSSRVINRDTLHLPQRVKGGDIRQIDEMSSRLALKTQGGQKRGWAHVTARDKDRIDIDEIDVRRGYMPQVTGMSLKDALFLIEQAGLKASFTGSGRVTSQSIEAGVEVSLGQKVVLELH